MDRIRTDIAKDCCGCGVCALQCPAGCISMEETAGGFLMPVIDSGSCLGCGACSAVCPMIRRKEDSEPVGVMAASSRDSRVRMSGSSGGIFGELARKTIADGGIVFGAAFDSRWNVVGSKAETESELLPLLKSKYVQADMRPAFKACREALDNRRKVLFCATPCQISGLKKYLGKDKTGNSLKARSDAENCTANDSPPTAGDLLAVDIVCHSVPGPGVWRKYLEELPSQHSCFTISRGESSGTYELSCLYHDNPYMMAFLHDFTTRPSCASCPSRGLKSSADITLGDFWGIERLIPEAWSGDGCSLVITHTDRGQDAIRNLDMRTWPTTFREASGLNASLVSSPAAERYRITLDSGNELVPQIVRHLPRPDARTLFYRKKKAVRDMVSSMFRKNPYALGRKEKAEVERLVRGGKYNICDVSFRDKRTGWKDYSISITIKTEA